MYDLESNNGKILTINYGNEYSLIKGVPSFNYDNKNLKDLFTYRGLKNYAISFDPLKFRGNKYYEKSFEVLKRSIGYALQNSTPSDLSFNKMDLNIYTSEDIQRATTKIINNEETSRKFFEALYKEGFFPLHQLFIGSKMSFSMFGFIGLKPLHCFNLIGSGLFDGMYLIDNVSHSLIPGTFDTNIEATLINSEPKSNDLIHFQLY